MCQMILANSVWERRNACSVRSCLPFVAALQGAQVRHPALHGVVDLLYARAHLVQAARADGKIVFYRLKTLGRPPPVFAVGKNRQSSSYSANSLLFRPHKKRRQRQKISDGNTSPHNQLTRRQNWQNLTEAQTSKMPQPRVASQFAIRQTGAACTICTICTEQSLQPVRPPRAFASFALAKLEAGGQALLS